MAYTGNIDAKHNTDGTLHQKGQGEENTCPQSWARVTFENGQGAVVMGNEAILAACPNSRCLATDLKVVDVKQI